MQFWKVFLCSYQSTQRPQPGLSVEYVQIDPIDIEGFNRLSMIRFDRILFVNQATRGQWLTIAFYPMAMA